LEIPFKMNKKIKDLLIKKYARVPLKIISILEITHEVNISELSKLINEDYANVYRYVSNLSKLGILRIIKSKKGKGSPTLIKLK